MTIKVSEGKGISSALQQLNKSNERLASGKRINKASDDAAGLAVASALLADSVVLTQGARNVSDGGAVTAIADGALQSVGDISIRLSELATQSANGTLSDSQRQSLNTEFQALSQEASRIAATSNFNGVSVFNSSTSIQVGTDSSSNSSLQIATPDSATINSALSGLSIDSLENARSAIEQISAFTGSVSSSRGSIGAVESRMEIAKSANESAALESKKAASRILDADIAEEAANRIGADIRAQVSTALAAQTNKMSAKSVLDLLR